VRDGVAELLQVLVGPPKVVARLPLLGDVADGGGYQEALVGVEGGQGDLGGEGGAVAAAAGQVQAGAHLPGLGVCGVPGAQGGVAGLDGVGDQDLDRLSGEFFARVPEQPLGLGVDQHDLPAGVHAHHRVRCRVQQPASDGISEPPHSPSRSALETILRVTILHPSAAATDADRLPDLVLPHRFLFSVEKPQKFSRSATGVVS